jgi:hypothetical protein
MLTPDSESIHLVNLYTYVNYICFQYLLMIGTWPTIDIKVTFFECILLREITVARIFWVRQSEERKNSDQPQNWPSLSRNVNLVNGQTNR